MCDVISDKKLLNNRKLSLMISHPQLSSKETCKLNYYVVTMLEHVAQDCSCNQRAVQSPCISDQDNAQVEWDMEFSNEHGVCRRAAEAKSTGGDDGVNPHCGSFQRCSVSLTA